MKHFILLWFLTLGMVGYTANMARVDKLMADLDKELANMPNSLAKGRR